MLQFLGDVNLFRATDANGAPSAGFQGDARTAYVRPHELHVVAASAAGIGAGRRWAQALTVGPNTRLEFQRGDDGSYVDVEMTRAEWIALRDRLGLKPGANAHLVRAR